MAGHGWPWPAMAPFPRRFLWDGSRRPASHQRVQPGVLPRFQANRQDRRAVAQWSGPRICNPMGWSVDPGNGQKLDERVREGSIWPDQAGKRNPGTDGFRDPKPAKASQNKIMGCLSPAVIPPTPSL